MTAVLTISILTSQAFCALGVDDNDRRQAEAIEALGHDEGTWKITKEKGLFTSGLTEKKCNRCNITLESKEISSTLPLWSLFAGIGVLVIIIAGIIIFVLKRKK